MFVQFSRRGLSVHQGMRGDMIGKDAMGWMEARIRGRYDTFSNYNINN